VLCKDHSAIASCLELILNQRLVRRLCADCVGKGCDECLQTGYRGRLPLVELLRVDGDVRKAIAAGDLSRIKATPSLADHAITLTTAGLTRAEETARVLGS
jgi:type II secretory ATPase GspE/PulE/Tfp pilus assembly ATPase PilB-like protein